MCEIKKMEACLQSIDKDCKEVLREGDNKIQTLKQESHQKSMKLHHTQKDVEVHKLIVKQLKKNLNFVAEERSKLKDKLKM